MIPLSLSRSFIPSTFAFFLTLVQILRVAHAQGLPSLPACASPCATATAIAVGCSATDTACICRAPNFIPATLTCAVRVCNMSDQGSAIGLLRELCSPFITSSTSSSGTASPTSSASTSPSPSASDTDSSLTTATGDDDDENPTRTPSTSAQSTTVVFQVSTVGGASTDLPINGETRVRSFENTILAGAVLSGIMALV